MGFCVVERASLRRGRFSGMVCSRDLRQSEYGITLKTTLYHSGNVVNRSFFGSGDVANQSMHISDDVSGQMLFLSSERRKSSFVLHESA